MSWPVYAAVAIVVTAAWLAAYRLPFAKPRTRQRVRLAVSSKTGLHARYVFPVLGTVLYLGLGIAGAAVLISLSPITFTGLAGWEPTWKSIPTVLLAVAGATALTGFAMSAVYAIRPRADVPDAVTGVRWVQEILALPKGWRWTVPMLSAGVEEFFFRGVVLIGLLQAGAPGWLAITIAGLIFTAGQMLLTESGMQSAVLGLASTVLSLVCGLLVLAEGSVIPALVIHASFAGYYTNMSAQRAPATLGTPR
jgi:hypothetical protein